MSIKRYMANADNTITNAFDASLVNRGTGSNMGASDILEVFSIYGQSSGSSGYTSEESKILINFPVSSIISDRSSKYIPASGSVKFYLKLFNAIHSSTTPTKYTLNVAPISSAWTEGFGLDMDEYKDLGVSNWISSSATTRWSSQGGDYLANTSSQYFELGTENLEIDITSQVEAWVSGTVSSNGLGIFLSPNLLSETRSYYTKKFFGRDSEYQLYRPFVEARWNSQIKDNRANFYISSSLLSSENVNTVYLYNFRNGKATDIPSVGTSTLSVRVYEALGGSASALPIAGGVSAGNNLVVTGGWISTGIYSASFAYTGSKSTIYDVWSNQAGTTTFHTGTINTNIYNSSDSAELPRYVLNIKNGNAKYYINDTQRFRLYVREKNWSPTIYTVASSVPESVTIEKVYYSLFRVQDNFEVVPYGTGSTQHTLLSFDEGGNYFDFDMSILEKGYMYGFKFAFDIQQNGQIQEQPYTFKFRVEE